MGETKPVAELLAGDGSPRWDVVTFAVECPRCGYNLRSLVQPRCPECGLEFAWPQVLDEALHHNPFLFEHNWRKRPVRSLLKTLWLSLRPQAFWSRVSIHEKVNARVLWLFVLASPVVFWVTLVASAWCLGKALQKTQWLWNPYGLSHYNPANMNMNSMYISPFEQTLVLLLDAYQWRMDFKFRLDETEHLVFLLAAVIVVLTTMGAVRMLWQTMGRYRIRGVQVLRVAAYASVPAAIVTALAYHLFLLLILYIDVLSEWSSIPMYWRAAYVRDFLWLCTATLPPGFYLAAGLKFYLKLPHARSVGMVSAFIGVLLMSVVLVLYGVIW